jgi:hypothetical protein
MRNAFLTIGAILGWFALISQFVIMLDNRIVPVLETIIRYFSFFTILTNILVAYCFTTHLIRSRDKDGKFFSHSKTVTAIAVYIVIVGIVYNTVLRQIWEPSGLQLVVDELLHSFIPLLFISYWLLFVPKANLRWIDVLSWLLYPMGYMVYVMIRGAVSGFYPYPFINPESIGYGKVLLNSALLCIAFLLVSLLLIAVAKKLQSQKNHSLKKV